ncbi:MAG: Smr/MutS family protein, partial [Polyangiaceae bacterium]
VYTHLSSLLSDALPSLEACREAIAKADLREATARLAEELALTFPTLIDEPKIDLRGARHPILALDLPKVVSSDLEIASGRAMIISGPNAGGKTVALKTLGLAALMIRAGLPVACDEGSTVGIFEVVLSDVGDDQSLTKSLSTFSAHISNIASILEETRPGALVLLDELAGGTDPREGEALAAGVLDSLSSRGGAVVTTTHYEGLKALALADERFANASVGFEIATMSPTFRVAMGVPGSSSALAVARRFGMPSTVIERAERFLSREDQNFETVVKRLNDERAALELARGAATSREEEARVAKAKLEAELDAAEKRETRALSRELESLVASLRRAQADLRSAQGILRAKRPDDSLLKEAARAIDRVAGAVSIGGELERLIAPQENGERLPVGKDDLRRGSKVYVPRLRSEGEVVELLPEGKVRVAVGAMKLTVALDTLRNAAPIEDEAKPPAVAKRESRETRPLEPAIMTTDNTCDLRGLRADDAVSLATTFLDRSINERRGVAFLLHGHGTGALKEAIRKELKASPYVAHFRPGNSDEGGDGVTVVWLA